MKKKTKTNTIIAATAIASGCLATYYYVKKHIICKEEEVLIDSNRKSKIHARIVVPQILGSFPLVMFFHGFGNDSELNGLFGELAIKLGKIGIGSIRLDFAGCGQSEESYVNNCLHNDLSDIDACYKYMLKNYRIDQKRLCLIGHSLGGRRAIIYSSYRKEFNNMVLLAPNAMAKFEMMEDFFGTTKELDSYKQIAEKEGFVKCHDRKLSLDFFNDMEKYDPLEAISEFEGNILYFQGNNDNIVKPEISGVVTQHLSEKVKLNYVYLDEVDHSFDIKEKGVTYQNIIKSIFDFVERNV